MTIRYVESREISGGVVKETLGAHIPEKGRLYVTDQFHNDWPNHNVSVFAKGADAVFLKGELKRICEDCAPRTLRGFEINSHPATDNQLRWTPTGAIEAPSDSSESSSPSKFRRFLTLFKR